MKMVIACGTYNPIHNAHLELYRYVIENFNYDKFLIIPSFRPPFKEHDDVLAKHRLNMIKLVLNRIEPFELCDFEYENQRISYTYFTVKELFKRYDIEGKISFIIGDDAYLSLDSWYKSDELKKMLNFVVFKRNNSNSKIDEMEKKGYDKINTDKPVVDISSSLIRKKTNQSETIKGLVPEEVEEYINKNGLYKN